MVGWLVGWLGAQPIQRTNAVCSASTVFECVFPHLLLLKVVGAMVEGRSEPTVPLLHTVW